MTLKLYIYNSKIGNYNASCDNRHVIVKGINIIVDDYGYKLDHTDKK